MTQLAKASHTHDATAASPPTGEDPTKGQIRRSIETLILGAAEKVFARNGFSGATMAAISTASGLPKANLHYYFGSKEVLYRAVLARTLGDWLAPTQAITADADPRAALEQYIRVKMALSAERPDGSKVFANEMLHGAPVVSAILKSELRPLVLEKSAVIQGWIDAGRMAPVDPTHLFFTIWAATQTYADFDAQVCAVLGRKSMGSKDYDRATEHVVSLLMRGCGL